MRTVKILYITIFVILSLLYLLFSSSCSKLNLFLGNVSQGSNNRDDPELIVEYDGSAQYDTITAETRSFKMGFTPFPYDYTDEAVDFTYSNINYHSDMVVHHFDNGVPWEEALNGSNMPSNILFDLNNRLSRTASGKSIYLAVTPLSTYRDKLAEYWGNTPDMELPGEWKNKKFDHPDIYKAFLNYCNFMIDKFKPEYFTYGIEVNMLGYYDQETFNDYLVLLENIYPELKSAYPDIPMILTIQLETFNNHFDTQKNIVESILPYTDYIAISTYPFGNIEDPAEIPADWFSRLYDISPDKPVAISETSYPAEDLYIERGNRNIKGTEEDQLEYLKLLLGNMSTLDFKFLTWFAIRDYDQLWELMAESGADEIFKSWRDTGLIDGDGKPRPALGYWDKWLSLPYIDNTDYK